MFELKIGCVCLCVWVKGYIPPYKTEFCIRGLAVPMSNRVAKRTATVLINIKCHTYLSFEYDAFDFPPVIGFCFFFFLYARCIEHVPPKVFKKCLSPITDKCFELRS